MANLYVVRSSDGSDSTPVSADEIKKRIQNGQIKEGDSLSLYPNQFAQEAKDFPEFEALFAAPRVQTESPRANEFAEDESTKLNTLVGSQPDQMATRIADVTKIRNEIIQSAPVQPAVPMPVPMDEFSDSAIKSEKTQVFERPKELLTKDVDPRRRKWVPQKSFLVMIVMAIVAMEYFDEEDEAKGPPKRPKVVMVPVRPKLPASGSEHPDPLVSVKHFERGLAYYALDTVRGYRSAVDAFQDSIHSDPQNVRSLAMLASSYLNLVESSNKDEMTFAVINKLIELSRVKKLDLLESLRAEVEFLAVQFRYDAAIQKIVDYSKTTGQLYSDMYYYLGWLSIQKGDYANALKYLDLIPPATIREKARLYYSSGYLHEEAKEFDEAIAEYKRALGVSKFHAKSILGLIRISEKKGELKLMKAQIRFLVANSGYMSPKEYVEALVFDSKLSLIEKRTESAIESLQNAIEIDPRNEALRLEYYSLLSNAEKNSRYQKLAQMYALVMEGERNRKAGKTLEAKAVFLQAQDVFSKSTVPFEKMGDLLFKNGEFVRAQANYKKALEIDPKAAEIAIKLIDSLIQNHEWEDAQKFLSKYKTHPKLKSSVDRLAGDLAYHQGNLQMAVMFYRKAMSRDSIDTAVYSAYANVMREVDECRDAQFFYSLAQRLDPFNFQAIIGSAKCLLKTDNVDIAVTRIQEVLARLPKARAELLAGIAEIYDLARDDAKSLQFVEQAKVADPDYPDSFKIEANVYSRQILMKKDAKKKALEAFKSYSDRKVSDPYGYLQRFDLFLADSNFELAQEELTKVFEVAPHFPELHYKRAVMYGKMGRVKEALNELESELKLNPRMDVAWVEKGNIHLRSNNPDEGLKAFAKAMEINPKNAQAKIGAGYANYQKRQFSTAVALLQAALALDKGNPDIYKKMGLAYRDSGDPGKARQFFQNYLDLAPDAPDRSDYEAYLK
jgi:tetratricopeptide (TPR) repeat protein